MSVGLCWCWRGKAFQLAMRAAVVVVEAVDGGGVVEAVDGDGDGDGLPCLVPGTYICKHRLGRSDEMF